ncbi:ribosome-associated ATPase/putative transporter RbbA [Telluria mixta]|uniref:Ribosome-associated ATPase/putative transporter RbbA n=1 Tax=Telluria mixta TaxID=34071 RepID=A0ABT2BSZ8_9BURK|nr:ribosome-associated ATPase/putative transporter RbbA [Telluria mixta]MCS0628245.1 ribosome-associated ATPase/putative transporter RbbA [Telluria mixta]WEM93641.1 ribosome-associated ATPase/putative transporter RbbA [Telluria mixta]
MRDADAAPVACLDGVSVRYGAVHALDRVRLSLPAGRMTALIGPDGVGKSSLLAVIAGARRAAEGKVEVLGGDMSAARFRAEVCPRIAYMPQGLGRNLYPSLTVGENLQFFARLFGLGPGERRARIAMLAASTGLLPFIDRPVVQLSGGMKQKLGLCCALVHDPDLLILDEPTTGVDPLARSQFWALIAAIRDARPGMSVVVATAYMDEARRFDWLVALDGGRVLASGTPAALLAQSGSASYEEAFVAMLPAERRAGYRPLSTQPRDPVADDDTVIQANGLSRRFGDFDAVQDVSFRIARGEIFGFIGSNGCGKTTTMKMLTGLLPPSGGTATVFGRAAGEGGAQARRQVGYMSQGFSLYQELTVRQNLALHARLFDLAESTIDARCADLAAHFGLEAMLDALPDNLPPGARQRLSLAVAMVHQPELLILDEPTSGVDPIARDRFWEALIALARDDGVTIFISTHFMNEAERCDRVALMHAGRVLATGTPAGLRAARGAATLEDAFIGWLRAAAPGDDRPLPPLPAAGAAAHGGWLRRAAGYAWREALELRRDPARSVLALCGSLLLMVVIGYGLNMDVEDLRFAVLDRDHTALSRDYALNLAGSRYFVERSALADYADMDARMRSGELALAIEIPPGFARAAARGRPAQIGAWIDGAMPVRAETVQAYLQGMHAEWLRSRAMASGIAAATIETRFRYNPDVRSLPAMVPGIMALLMLMLPAMQAALAVVREKEMGSIVNLYVTPVRRSEFLLGKQAPYVVLAMANFMLMCVMAVTVFQVPLKGSAPALAVAALLYCVCSTGIGLLASSFTRSQIAALLFTMIGTIVPAIQFAGLIDPVVALEGVGRVIGEAYPASHMLTISRGVFGKALGFAELAPDFLALVAAVPVILGLAIVALPKQER